MGPSHNVCLLIVLLISTYLTVHGFGWCKRAICTSSATRAANQGIGSNVEPSNFIRRRALHSRTYLSASESITSSTEVSENENWSKEGYRRPLHWVLKIGSLEANLKFFQENFGMRVFRHEEFETGCAATCNGPYQGAWSKTMIGNGPSEQTSFALELTYNYGIADYRRGNDLRYIAVRSSSFTGPLEAIQLSEEGEKFIESPDGYWFRLLEDEECTGREDSTVEYVSLYVSDLADSLYFYRDVLGARSLIQDGVELPVSVISPSSQRSLSSLLYFNDEASVKLQLVQVDHGTEIDRGEAHGRFAIETEDGGPGRVAARVADYDRTYLEKSVHGPVKLQPHNEEVVIVEDPNGHEICFVDARGFKTCTDVAEKKDGNVVDWESRKKVESIARERSQRTLSYDQPVIQIELKGLLRMLIEARSLEKEEDNGFDVVIDLYAVWCPKCITIKPAIESLARRVKEATGNVRVVVMDGSIAKNDLVVLKQNVCSDNKSHLFSDRRDESDGDRASPFDRDAYESLLSDMEAVIQWTQAKGFPTFFYFNHRDSTFTAFDGDIDEPSLSAWIVSQPGNEGIILSSSSYSADSNKDGLDIDDDDDDDCGACTL